jgi:transposase
MTSNPPIPAPTDVSTESKIIKMHLAHLSYDEIQTQLGVGRTRISTTIHRFHEFGVIPDAPRIGRPRKWRNDLIAFIEARTLREPSISGMNLSIEIEKQFGVPVSRTTINIIRQQLRFKYRPPRHNQMLTSRHVAERIAFCEKMLSMKEISTKIHFSDESRVVLGDDKGWIWYRAGEDNPNASVSSKKFPESLMVFAVIGVDFKSDLLVVQGTIDTDQYLQNIEQLAFIEALDEKHGPFGWIFQQDGAPCHTSRKALDWLEESVDLIVDWPANSPDLSPIELLWAILKQLIKRIRPDTIEDLKNALIAAWALIPQSSIDKLCEGFENRLELCLANGGQSISNQLWRLTERHATKDFLEANQIRTPWTASEDEQLIRDWLSIGPRWKFLEKKWGTRSASQLKNRWYHELRCRLHGPDSDFATLTRVLEDGRKCLPIPAFSRA